MRDPMSWALPVFRAFGIPVKVHLFFFIVTLGLFLRQVSVRPDYWWLDIFLLVVVVLFVSVLLHEFGHCFGARHVGGDAKDILIWPLGGLATVDVPHRPKPLFVMVAAGPAVNVVICVVCALGIISAGYYPALNPVVDPYQAELYNFRKDRVETAAYAVKLYKPGTNEEFRGGIETPVKKTQVEEFRGELEKAGAERGLVPTWVAWAYRIFWMNWVLFLFNLLPAYPLDGGQLLQSFVWARTDYRRGVVVAAYSGFAVSVIFLVVSIAANESLFMGLALFMLYAASMKLFSLELEDGPFGYDFSEGYTSLEKDEEPAPKPKPPGWFTRWRQARKARKMAREAEQRAADEERMDQLLEKIARSGKASLTDEERRFLERVSARKRHLS